MNNLKVYVIPEYEGLVEIPKFATEGSACFDLKVALLHNPLGDAPPIKYYNLYNEEGFHYVNNEIVSHRFDLPIEDPQHGAEVIEKVNHIVLGSGDRALIPTGLIFDIPEGYSIRLHIRSSLAFKQGLVLANGEGVIDSDYINQTFLLVENTTADYLTIRDGDRIAQAELVKNEVYTIDKTLDVPVQKTDRIGGVGSTGKK